MIKNILMKLFKFILVLCISVSITSCNDNTAEPDFLLSNANIAGTYTIKSLSSTAKATAITSGIPVTISNATIIGDTFTDFSFTLNANGSYTASGPYRITTTVTPVGSNAITDISILTIEDAGTFQINTIENTITFTSNSGDFIEGTLNVITFNETTLSLSQETEEVEDPITTEIKTNITFIKL